MANFAIIGLGKMGRFYDQAIHADYVVDLFPADHKNFFRSVEEFLEYRPKVDLVIVSTPTNTHFEISSSLLEENYNVLVEKPICLTVEETKELEKKARRKKCILYQSTLERYNPVVTFFKNNLDLANVSKIESFRIGPRPKRSYVEDVAFDLGIHEVDLYLYLNYAKVPWQINVGYKDLQQREIIVTLNSGEEIIFDLLNKWIKGPKFEYDLSTGTSNNPMVQMIYEILFKGTRVNELWSKEIKILGSFKDTSPTFSRLSL